MKVTELPDKYTPSCLRSKKIVPETIKYGIGIYGRDQYEAGMLSGPYDSVFDALDEIGYPGHRIFELPSGIELYSWNEKASAWLRVK